jgi:subtilisin family serine protease
MKKTVNAAAGSLLLFFLFSCEKEGFLTPDHNDYKSGIVVFMDPSIGETLGFQDGNKETEEILKSKKEELKKFVKKKYSRLELDPENIHIDKDIWFFSSKVSSKQIDKLENDKGENVLDIYPNYSLSLQGRKPMMQGNPLPQGRKPMMQEDWRYDAAKFTSELVLWIGGGDLNSLPPVSSDRTVWIMDTGIDITHQDLNGIVVSDLGFSAFSNSTFTQDENGHGTLIAGLIGAKAYNQTEGNPADIGINGVYPRARMVSVKVLDENGDSNLDNLIKGLKYIEQNAQVGDVVNISLGRDNNGPNCNWGQLGNKIKRLADEGIYFVFSAGNETSPNSTNFPSCLADGNFMISVGSIDMYCNGQTLVYSSFSNFGTLSFGNQNSPIWVAPGNQIFSTYPPALVGDGTDRGTYGLVAGTSFSAAIMSGIIYTHGRLPDGNSTLKRGGDNLDYPIAKARE